MSRAEAVKPLPDVFNALPLSSGVGESVGNINEPSPCRLRLRRGRDTALWEVRRGLPNRCL